jgi:hypothetical protein
MGGDTGWSPGEISWSLRRGIFVSSPIGATSGIESKLRACKGRQVEERHTVILGWSSQTLPSFPNQWRQCQPVACIAIPVRRTKGMEDETTKVGTGRLRLACCRGSPVDLTDLEIINPHNARSIIILA